MALLNHIKKLDWMLIVCAVLVTAFGLAGIFSASFAKGEYANFVKQLIFLAVGIGLMIFISFFDYRILRNNSYLILFLYFLSLLLLIGLYFFAPLTRGTRGWYKIGFISLDPVEIMKIVLIVLLAKYFSMRHIEMYKFRHIFLSGIYVALPLVLIFLKPDLGGAMVLLFIWLGILVVSGIKVKHFLILFLCFILVLVFSWSFLFKDYQRERVISFIFPDALGGSWSQSQAKIAIGSGKIFGTGLAKGSQVQYGFLPEPHTDFIFSVIAEEWGMLGIGVFFVLYLLLIWRVMKIAIHSQSNFSRLFALGFAIMLVSQFLINIAMNLSLLPVVGIYLPFVSYGGSGLIANFISLGILQSIKTKG